MVFPTQTYNGENYWADLSFVPGGPSQPDGVATAAGGFTSPSTFVVAPDQIDIGRVTAIDPEDDDLTFEIVGGRARGLFELDPDSGELSFRNGPPGLLRANNLGPERTIDLVVRASDPSDNFVDKAVTIKVGGGSVSGPPGFIDLPDVARPDLVELRYSPTLTVPFSSQVGDRTRTVRTASATRDLPDFSLRRVRRLEPRSKAHRHPQGAQEATCVHFIRLLAPRSI